jgi:thymidylate synthase (FAD)
MKRNEKSSKYLDKRIPVLDKGYVELCDYMGGDESIVRCARQSYGKDEDELTPEMIDRQICDMLRNGHSSPFEQVVFQFNLKMPIFVQRQFCRHRTARVNEISGRYTKFDKDNFHVPGEWALLSRKSYSDETCYEQASLETLKKIIGENNESSYNAYQKLLDTSGIPYELARLNLPLTLYTEFYWQIDLHNLLHFLKLRMDEHAQKEIRQYAITLYKIVKDICPIAINYFTEYQLNAVTLSEKEIKCLSKILNVELSQLPENERGVLKKIFNTVCRNNDRSKYLSHLDSTLDEIEKLLSKENDHEKENTFCF